MNAVLRIQAVMRGKLVRQRMKKIKQLLRHREEMSGVFDSTIND